MAQDMTPRRQMAILFAIFAVELAVGMWVMYVCVFPQGWGWHLLAGITYGIAVGGSWYRVDQGPRRGPAR